MKMNDFFIGFVLPVMGLSADTDDYEETYLSCGNLILRECFEVNNAVRRFKGLEPLAEFEDLAAEAEIPYEEETMKECCVYGWAAAVMIDDTDDEFNKYGILADKYESAKLRLGLKTFAEAVSDYGI